jgi:hypothetical protein
MKGSGENVLFAYTLITSTVIARTIAQRIFDFSVLTVTTKRRPGATSVGTRIWYNGITSPCHGEDGGSIPPIRSNEEVCGFEARHSLKANEVLWEGSNADD